MAITVDTGNVSNATPTSNASSPQTWPHTTGADVKMVVVTVTIYDTSATDGVVSSVVFGGKALGLGTQYYDSLSGGHVSIWYRANSDVASITAGNIFVTFGGTVTDFMAGAVGVESSLGDFVVDAVATEASGTSGNPSMNSLSTVTQPSLISFGAMLTDQSDGTKVSVQIGETLIYKEDVGGDTVAASYEVQSANLISSLVNGAVPYDFDTFTTSGTDVTSAIDDTEGVVSSQTQTIPTLGKGDTYLVRGVYTKNSGGDLEVAMYASGRNLSTLVSDISTVTGSKTLAEVLTADTIGVSHANCEVAFYWAAACDVEMTDLSIHKTSLLFIDSDGDEDWVMVGMAFRELPYNAPPTVNLDTDEAYDFGTDTTPDLLFTGTDPDDDNITYQLQIATDNSFTPKDVSYDYWDPIGISFSLVGDPITRLGQSFKNVSLTETLRSCEFYLVRSSAPTGLCYAEIYAHTGTFGTSGVPSGSVLATSDGLDVENISDWYVDSYRFYFSGDDQITLDANTPYCVVFYYDNGGAGLNRVRVWLETPGTDDGNGFVDESPWAAKAYDFLFHVNYFDATGSIMIDKKSDRYPGFSGSGDPFDSTEQITYTVQGGEELTTGTYYWRVRGRDTAPASGTMGNYSSSKSFIITEGGATSVTRNNIQMII